MQTRMLRRSRVGLQNLHLSMDVSADTKIGGDRPQQARVKPDYDDVEEQLAIKGTLCTLHVEMYF